jgi:hypothetical protein
MHEYTFLFRTGQALTHVIDSDAGDTIDLQPDVIQVSLAAKANIFNPDEMLPAEDSTIWVPHLMSMQHRVKEVQIPTREQLDELRKALQLPERPPFVTGSL